MDVVWTLLGAALIALALRDIFDVLFHPLGRGMVARYVIHAVSAIPGGRLEAPTPSACSPGR